MQHVMNDFLKFLDWVMNTLTRQKLSKQLLKSNQHSSLKDSRAKEFSFFFFYFFATSFDFQFGSSVSILEKLLEKIWNH